MPLPTAPTAAEFPNPDELEEARGWWQMRVGRILALQEKATAASSGSPAKSENASPALGSLHIE